MIILSYYIITFTKMGRTFRNNSPKEKNISNKNAPKKLNKEKRTNNNQFKKFDYTSKDYD
jgi:hypothetical protein